MRNAVTCGLTACLVLYSSTAFAQARAWLPFFVDAEDIRILLDHLNSDPDVAFIIPNGPLESDEDRARAIRKLLEQSGRGATSIVTAGRLDTGHRQQWRSVKTVDALADGHHALWYRPGGPLPLLKADRASDQPIPDPFAGWTEEVPSGQAFRPYFGPSSPADIRLTLWTRHRPYTPEERKTVREQISYWMGDRDYLVASDFQHIAVSDAWLVRLEHWMSTVAVRLGGPDRQDTWWAFPSALRKLKTGTRYYANGFNLDRSIREAQVPARQ
jgi:hypothetical protein